MNSNKISNIMSIKKIPPSESDGNSALTKFYGLTSGTF
jgi:hypothetical protein